MSKPLGAIEQPIDERFVIVEIAEDDFREFKEFANYPVRDLELANLLEKILVQKPAVIGLDLYRDVSHGNDPIQKERLDNLFRNTENLIGIEKAIPPKILPPPALKGTQRLGANDILNDPGDGVLRRALMAFKTKDEEGKEIHNITFGLHLVFEYLVDFKKGKIPQVPGSGYLKFGDTVVEDLPQNAGSYVKVDSGGYQFLINWRIPPNKWNYVRVSDVLKGQIDSDIFKDKIVLIGATGESLNDFVNVPYNRHNSTSPTQIPGVAAQANIVKQLIDLAEGKTSLIQFLPENLEILFILMWFGFTFLFISFKSFLGKERSPNRLLFDSAFAIILLSVLAVIFTYLAFLRQNYWLPIYPCLLVIGCGGFFTALGIYVDITRQKNKQLESLNARIKTINQNLKQTNANLENFLAALPVGVFIATADRQPYYKNKIADNILGPVNNSNRTKELHYSYSLFSPESSVPTEPSALPLYQALEGKETKGAEFEIISGEQRIPIEVNATPIFDENKRITHAIASFQDISDRKQREREKMELSEEVARKNFQLEESNKNLEKQVKLRTQELTKSNELLRETQKKLIQENYSLKENGTGKYFHLGGRVPSLSPSYVIRYADAVLEKSLKAGEYCYVFNGRTMGKSSLLARTYTKFEDYGYKCIDIDMSSISSPEITEEQWYYTLVDELTFGFDLAHFDYDKWWTQLGEHFSPCQKFNKFIKQVLLKSISEPIIIFIDEIDSLIQLKFNTDNFFVLLKSFYNTFNNQDFKKLNIVLLGTANPFTLIKDRTRSPFNIGQIIRLEPFEFYQLSCLERGLKPISSRPEILIQEILSWTGGQPFLTQKLCLLLIQLPQTIPPGEEKEIVTNIVQEDIIQDWLSKDYPQHLRTISDRILFSSSSQKLLKLYQELLEKEELYFQENSPLFEEFLLTGLVSLKNEKLKVYNQIYLSIFDLDWLKSHLNH